MTLLLPEKVTTESSTDDDICHVVCHCTDNKISACGLDLSKSPWVEGFWEEGGKNEIFCPLCVLTWPPDATTCPWGCSCEKTCGPIT